MFEQGVENVPALTRNEWLGRVPRRRKDSGAKFVGTSILLPSVNGRSIDKRRIYRSALKAASQHKGEG
jgi:hypothetical protein